MRKKGFRIQYSVFSRRVGSRFFRPALESHECGTPNSLCVSASPRDSSLHPASFILHPFPSGFSLIELLVVVGIILILSALLVPSMRSISGGTNLTGAAEDLAAVVNLARQRASTFNRQVSIRFFRESGSAPFFSYQLWEQKDSANPSSWAAIERVRKLPTGIVVTNSATFSPLLEIAGNQGTTNGTNYSEALFLPSGSLLASSTNAIITLIPERGPATGGVVSGLPPNFATVNIEPVNARPTIYRP